MFKEQIGSITSEEQAELDDMRRQVQKRLQELSEIDRETIKALLREVDLNDKATVAHRRSIALSHALGLTSESRLLQAHQGESHLEGTLLIGGLSAGTALFADRIEGVILKDKGDRLTWRYVKTLCGRTTGMASIDECHDPATMLQ